MKKVICDKCPLLQDACDVYDPSCGIACDTYWNEDYSKTLSDRCSLDFIVQIDGTKFYPELRKDVHNEN